tara:strand:- start:15 stop:671 length:657 start_codon:yes stop_codon:yes gene_type:complete
VSRENIKKKVRKLYNTHPYKEYAVSKKVALAKQLGGKKILDAGCGAGNQLFDHIFAGAKATGVDQSEASINFLREQLAQTPFTAKLILADLESVKLPKNEYDVIFCIGVLHHTPNPLPILHKFREAGKKGSKIELLLYHKHSLENAIRKVVSLLPIGVFLSDNFKRKIEWWDKYENPYWKTYTRRSISRLCKKAGLRITKLYTKKFGWHLMVECTPRK